MDNGQGALGSFAIASCLLSHLRRGAAAPIDPVATAFRADRVVTGAFLQPSGQMRAYLLLFPSCRRRRIRRQGRHVELLCICLASRANVMRAPEENTDSRQKARPSGKGVRR